MKGHSHYGIDLPEWQTEYLFYYPRKSYWAYNFLLIFAAIHLLLFNLVELELLNILSVLWSRLTVEPFLGDIFLVFSMNLAVNMRNLWKWILPKDTLLLLLIQIAMQLYMLSLQHWQVSYWLISNVHLIS